MRNLDFFIRGKIKGRAERREQTRRAVLKFVKQNRPKAEEPFLKWVSVFSLKASGIAMGAVLLLVFFFPRKKSIELTPKNDVALDQPLDLDQSKEIDDKLANVDFDLVLKQDFYSKMKLYKKFEILKKWDGKLV